MGGSIVDSYLFIVYESKWKWSNFIQKIMLCGTNFPFFYKISIWKKFKDFEIKTISAIFLLQFHRKIESQKLKTT